MSLAPRFALTAASLVPLLLAVGCTPKENATGAEAGPPSASASASATLVASASAAPVTSASDPIPSHSDAAKKVRAEIDKSNYKTELDKIEKELE